MSDEIAFWENVRRICRKKARFDPKAYGFVMESLGFTVRRLDEPRHVSAGELLDGLCDHARQRYGLLAFNVLDSWGIRSAGDIGRIVFDLIEVGELRKRAEDRLEDFNDDYDLKRALEEDYFD